MSRDAARHTSTGVRAIGLPLPVTVHVDASGLPISITRTGARRGSTDAQRVESVEEVWRIAEAWWREEPQARTYVRVILDGGRLLTVFRDERSGRWYEQRY